MAVSESLLTTVIQHEIVHPHAEHTPWVPTSSPGHLGDKAVLSLVQPLEV